MKSQKSDFTVAALEKQIGVLTTQIIESYQDPEKTPELGRYLSKLHDLLQTHLLHEDERLTDAYLTCAVRLLNNVLRNKSTTDQFVQEIFGSIRRYQTLFLQTLYWGLLRPWIIPSTSGADFGARHLEKYLEDLRQHRITSSRSCLPRLIISAYYSVNH